MHVAFISYYQNLVNRGVENWLKELIPHLDSKIEVKIFSPKKTINCSQDHSFSLLRKFFLDPWSLAIMRHTKNIFPKLKNFDLIIPLNGGWQTLLAKLASRKFGSKLVVIGHSGLGRDDRWNLFCRPDLFVALTQSQAKWARQYYSRSIHVVPNGIDLKKFSPQGPKLKLELKSPVILCAASLQKKAFFKNLILAVKDTPASLAIAGSGDQKQEKLIDNFAQKHLPNRYLRRQFKPQQMPSLYRTADLFVYPNPPYESFGLVFLEALASNLPVIATDDPIRHEIIGKAGLFINPACPHSISTAITQALKTNWGTKPRQQAEKLSWDKIGKKYSQILLS